MCFTRSVCLIFMTFSAVFGGSLAHAAACGPVPGLPSALLAEQVTETKLAALRSEFTAHQARLLAHQACLSGQIHSLPMPLVNDEPAPEASPDGVRYQADFDALVKHTEQVSQALAQLDARYNALLGAVVPAQAQR